MLGTAQADAFGAQLTRFDSVGGGVGVGAHTQGAELVRPRHDAAEFARDLRVNGRDDAVVDVTGGTIDGDVITLVVGFAGQRKFLVFLVHHDVAATGHTAGAHAARHNRRVGGHTAAHRQDALRGFHAGDVFGRGFQTNQNDLLAAFVPFHRVVSREHDFTAGSAGRSAQTFAGRSSRFQRFDIKLRVQQGVQVTRVDHGDRLFLIDHAFVHQVAGDLQSRFRGTFAVTGLQHIQFAGFHGELHILHIAVVILQSGAHGFELRERFRELFRHFGDGHGSAHTSHNVFALRVDQELAHQAFFAGRGVTGEGHAGTAIVTHVTERHHLHVDSGTPGIRDVVVTTINVCSRVVPGTEYGFYSLHQLYLRIGREILTDFSFVLSFELLSQFFEVICVKIYVLFYAFLLFHLVDQLFEVFFTNFHNYVREHLNETSIGIVNETLECWIWVTSDHSCYYFVI